MTFSVEGRTAVVTGAANGVGLAIARHLLDAGANVMLADRDEDRLEAAIEGLDPQDRERARCFAGDLREKLTHANLLSAVIDEFESVDILVNASRQVLTDDPLDEDQSALTAMLDQNFLAALRLSQVIARRMIRQADGQVPPNGAGTIVNISSIAARRVRPDLMAFSVACAALDQMTRSLAVALAPHGIRVNGVSFGSVMSASLQNRLREDDTQRDRIIEATPLGGIGDPARVAEAVQYLASPASNFVTGQILTVDGGRTLIDPAFASAH